ncbi:MAG: hypothetical protein Q9182_006221 [Xanthomendoza sp. 2 TL-2023]
MAESSSPPTSPYFNLTYPIPYVAHVEINRPEKLNAFIEPMWLHLPPLFSHLSSSPTTRVIILSGAGPKAFTAGLDLHAASTSGPLAQLSPSPPAPPSPNQQQQQQPTTYSLPTGTPYTTQTPPPPSPPPPLPASSSPDPARLAHTLLTSITTFQTSISSLSTCRKPILALLHGHCYGLGIELALCADIRFATPTATFAVKEIDIGIAADLGLLSRLGKMTASESWVKDVCFSGRVFRAAEALRFGLVSRVVGGARENEEEEEEEEDGDGEGKEAAMREALGWAETVAGKSPVAVQGSKEIIEWSRGRSVEDGLRYTAVWNAAMLQTEDVGRAMREKGGRRRRVRFEKL